MTGIKCPRCSYYWEWKGKLLHAICPNCRKMFKPDKYHPDHDEWRGMQE